MAKPKRSRQSWWQLDLLVLMMIGLLFLTHHLAPAPGWRTFLEVVVLVVGFGLIALWLETRPNMLRHRPSTKAHSQVIESAALEMPPTLSSHIPGQFDDGSDPAIIGDETEPQNGHLRLNGHHLASTTPYPPREGSL